MSYTNPMHEYSSQPFDASTPPPPPPKPGRNTATPQESSGGPTPHNAPPRPPPPNENTPNASHSQSHLQSPHPLPPSASDHWLPPLLLDKPTTALQPILTNTPLLTALSSTHPSLTPSPLPPHLAHTASLASHLSTRHAHLLSVRQQTQTHLLQLRALEHQWRSKQSLMDEQLEPWSAKSLYQRLSKAEKEGEEISKAMEESWMDGSDGDVEGFLRRYREGRKAVARRREMRERWDEGRVGGWR